MGADTGTLIAALAMFAVVLIVLLVLRGFSGGKFEVRLADAVIAVLPGAPGSAALATSVSRPRGS